MSEARTIVRHAGTLLIGQVAVVAFGLIDTVVAGRYAENALAALAVGTAVFVTVYASLMGVLQAQLPIWAQLRGGAQQSQIGRSVRQALYLCAAASLLGMTLLCFPGPLLRWAEVPPAMRAAVTAYLQILALALPATLLFRLFSTLNQSLGHPGVVTWLQLAALVLKLPLSIWLTFGAGLPALGLAGCAWATLIVQYAMLAAGICLLQRQPLYRPLQIWRRLERIDWAHLRGFARLGVPAGLAVLVEVTSFTWMALFIARLGSAATASHQIAANLAVLAYMVPLSLAIASSARVSYWLGAADPDRAAAAGRCGLRLAIGIALLLATAMVLARAPLAALYTRNAALASAAAALLVAAATYHIADAVQTVCIFLLRCYGITVMPLAIYGVMLWGVGLGEAMPWPTPVSDRGPP